MKKLLVGTAIGAVIGGVLYALNKQGKLDGIKDDMNVYARKTRRNIKNAVDVSKNEVEYLKDRVAYEVNKGKKR